MTRCVHAAPFIMLEITIIYERNKKNLREVGACDAALHLEEYGKETLNMRAHLFS